MQQLQRVAKLLTANEFTSFVAPHLLQVPLQLQLRLKQDKHSQSFPFMSLSIVTRPPAAAAAAVAFSRFSRPKPFEGKIISLDR